MGITVASLNLPQSKAVELMELIEESSEFWEVPCSANEIDENNWQVQLYFEHQVPVAKLEETTSKIIQTPTKWTVENLEEENWVAKSLSGLKPIEAGRFLVHGSHDRGPATLKRFSIEIDAAQAFGTGHHETTKGCLLAINAATKSRSYKNPLDLGTGSGVLAIALAKSLYKRVLATDIDPIATQTAKENAGLNHVANMVETQTATGLDHPLIRAKAPFDLIVANILANPLIAMARTITSNCEAGGLVILSGILQDQARRVSACYRQHGFKLVRSLELNGWAVLILCKKH